jgi:hypothetical protein
MDDAAFRTVDRGDFREAIAWEVGRSEGYPDRMNSPLRHSAGRDYLFGALLALTTLAITSAPEIGDTLVYVNSIRDFQIGHWTTQFNPLGEFGHLLWRPLGALLAPIFTAVVPDAVAWNAKLKIGYGLIVLNEAAAVFAAAVFFQMARRISGSSAVAALIAAGLVWANGFLLYTKAGTVYVFGTAIEIAAIWVLVQSEENASAARPLISGALLGIAALCWTPFALTVPAAAAIPWAIGKRTSRANLRTWVMVAAASAVVYLIVLMGGAWLSGVKSPPELLAWIFQAEHGLMQNRKALRAVSGLARLLFDLSNDGLLLKRFLLKDPFNPVTLFDLIRLSLWKIALFYTFLLALALAAARFASGRRMLAVLVIAAAPMLMFAIFLFEPSSPERFLPVLPFLLLTLAASWKPQGSGETKIPGGKWAPWVGGALLAALIPINARAFIGSGTQQDRLAIAQLRDFSQAAAPGDLLVSVLIREPVNVLIEQQPFNPVRRGLDVATYQVFGTVGQWASWRTDLARHVLAQWESHKDAWITKWAMRDRPPAPMGWVEGDDPTVRWREIPEFFEQFDFDRSTPLPDGFERMARSERNREIVESLLSGDASRVTGQKR